MKRENFTTIHKTADNIGFISRAISIIHNSEDLYIINDDNIRMPLDFNGIIKIPEDLKEEFKQKLLEYFVSKYNESVNKLKDIEL